MYVFHVRCAAQDAGRRQYWSCGRCCKLQCGVASSKTRLCEATRGSPACLGRLGLSPSPPGVTPTPYLTSSPTSNFCYDTSAPTSKYLCKSRDVTLFSNNMTCSRRECIEFASVADHSSPWPSAVLFPETAMHWHMSSNLYHGSWFLPCHPRTVNFSSHVFPCRSSVASPTLICSPLSLLPCAVLPSQPTIQVLCPLVSPLAIAVGCSSIYLSCHLRVCPPFSPVSKALISPEWPTCCRFDRTVHSSAPSATIRTSSNVRL